MSGASLWRLSRATSTRLVRAAAAACSMFGERPPPSPIEESAARDTRAALRSSAERAAAPTQLAADAWVAAVGSERASKDLLDARDVCRGEDEDQT
eukprot:scaffold2063_cov401-Prasinococcus_capsulatus_cf.AAC.15